MPSFVQSWCIQSNTIIFILSNTSKTQAILVKILFILLIPFALDCSAINNLGIFYLEGKAGLKQDYKEALRLFTLACKAENGLGSSNIAYVYEEGKGVEKNYKKAAEYYSLAVEQGENEALLDLARLYENGSFGLAKNLKKSKEYEAQWDELQKTE